TRMRRLLSMRRDFVANVSHEFQTPVTAIQGYSETLLRGPVGEADAKQFLEIIHRQASRLGALVQDLLRLSAIEARPDENLTIEPVDMGAVVAHVVAAVRARAEEAKARVKVEVDDGTTVMGDAASVEQVTMNLVDNAIKYGRQNGGEVLVRAAKDGDHVTLAV